MASNPPANTTMSAVAATARASANPVLESEFISHPTEYKTLAAPIFDSNPSLTLMAYGGKVSLLP